MTFSASTRSEYSRQCEIALTVGCCGRLAEMHISVARDMVFRHMTYIAFITKYFVRSYVWSAQSLNVILTTC